MLQVREEMAQLSLGAAPTLPDQEAVPTLLSLLPSDTVISPKEAFSSVPKSYDEAAQLDGAGRLKVFFVVALPMAVPSIVLCLLFSLVWYWNETAQVALLIGGDEGCGLTSALSARVARVYCE